MNMKGKMIRLSACLLILLAGIALATLSGLRAADTQPQQALTRLTFWTVSERYADYMLSCAQAYNHQAEGEQIELDVQVYSRDFIVDRINKSLLNDEQVPDLADIRFTDMHRFVNSAEHSMFLYPLDALLSGKDRPKDAALDAFSFNNILLALPYGLGEMALFVNEEVLHQQGVDPLALQSWEDFFALGDALHRQGVSLFAMDANNWDMLLAMMLQRDSELANDADSERIAASPELRELVEALMGAVERGWAEIPEELDIYNQRFYESFEAGAYLCVAAPMEYACELIDHAEKLSGKVGIYPLPSMQGEESAPLVAQYGTAILARSKNIRLAKRFLEFAKLGEERYQQMADQLCVRSISGAEAQSYAAPENAAFREYFGANAFDGFQARSEIGYLAESGLPEALAPLTEAFLSVYDH